MWQRPLTCKRCLHSRDRAAPGSRYLVHLSAEPQMTKKAPVTSKNRSTEGWVRVNTQVKEIQGAKLSQLPINKASSRVRASSPALEEKTTETGSIQLLSNLLKGIISA